MGEDRYRGEDQSCGGLRTDSSGLRGDLRSYGRRRARKLSNRQSELLRQTLPRVSFDLKDAHNVTDAWLEIGFGGGEHLIWQAKHNPSTTLIGCEPFEDGVVKVLSAIETENMSNIRVHMGDARDVLRLLPDACLERVFVLFPDPWPKKKHQKRRLISPATLEMLARVMKPGSELRIATDIGDYARTVLEALNGSPSFHWLAECSQDWRVRPPDWPPTRYEAKAEQAGRKRYYFRFARR